LKDSFEFKKNGKALVKQNHLFKVTFFYPKFIAKDLKIIMIKIFVFCRSIVRN